MRSLILGAVAALMLAGAAVAGPVTLKANPVDSDGRVTLGDLFDGAGGASNVVVGTRAGPSIVFEAGQLQSLARQSGLDWANPTGLRRVVVRNAAVAPTSAAPAPRSPAAAADSAPPVVAARPQPVRTALAERVITRNDMVEVAYEVGGVRLTITGRAEGNAAAGQRRSHGPWPGPRRPRRPTARRPIEGYSSMRTVMIVTATALILGACSTAIEAVRGPELAPIGYPAALMPTSQTYLPSPEQQHADRAASANSLWRAGARTFFGDQRARRIGDIVTVNIDIDDRAQTQNSTARSRTNQISGGVTNFFGLENSLGQAFPGGFDPANLVGLEGESNSNGSGSVNRSEKVSLTIAAVVTDVMANGNLVIQGRQEVRTNREVRELTVAGIVRPEDISSANTVAHTQIAEARISYGGRGDISRVQAAPAAQSLVERFSPF